MAPKATLSAPRGETKSCRICGREMQWRKAWARNWDEVRTCSQACRRRRLRAVDHRLEAAILMLLADRPGTATICPSEAARAIGAEGWRSLMDDTRRAARRLAAADLVEIRQRGAVVDPSHAKGPIRLGRGHRFVDGA